MSDPIRARLDEKARSSSGAFLIMEEYRAALRAVLDQLDNWDHRGRDMSWEIRRVIAEHLGVTDVS